MLVDICGTRQLSRAVSRPDGISYYVVMKAIRAHYLAEGGGRPNQPTFLGRWPASHPQETVHNRT